MAEISEALQERFRFHSNDPEHLETVIITLRPEADAGQLEQMGMRVERKMANRPIVVGKINSATLGTLSKLDDIVRIELDSTMRAI